MNLNTKEIRADIVARLKGAEPTTGPWPTMAEGRVENSRAVPFEPEELPGISVITVNTSDNEFSLGGFMAARHTDRVAIVAEVSGDDGGAVADLLDDFEEQITACLFGDLDWVRQVAVDKVDAARRVDASTGFIIGRVAIVLDLAYARNFEPTATFPALKAIYVDTEPSDPAGANVSDRPILQVNDD